MGHCQLAHVPEGWPECVGKRVPHQSKRLECCKRVAVPLGAAKGVFALVTVHPDFRATRPLPGPARATRPPHRFHSIHFLTRLCMHSGGLPLSPVAPKRVHRAQAARALVPKQGKTPAGEWIHEVDALFVCRCKLPWSSEGLLEKIAQCFLTSAIRVAECECRCRRPAASTWIRNRSQVRVIRAPQPDATGSSCSLERLMAISFPTSLSVSPQGLLQRPAQDKPNPSYSGQVRHTCSSSLTARIAPNGRWEPAARRCMKRTRPVCDVDTRMGIREPPRGTVHPSRREESETSSDSSLSRLRRCIRTPSRRCSRPVRWALPGSASTWPQPHALLRLEPSCPSPTSRLVARSSPWPLWPTRS